MSRPSVSLLFDCSTVAADGYIRRLRGAPPIDAGFQLGITLRDDVRQMARRGWEDRTRSEYVGVMIVRHLHGLLVDLNAPVELQELAILMMLEEQRHTGLCIEAARALGSSGELSFEVEELRMARTAAPLAEQLWQMILGTYLVGEVTALGLLRHAIKALPRSPFREVLRRIARDEVLHARIGSLVLRDLREASQQGRAGWLDYPGDGWVLDTVERHIGLMRARDVVEPDEALLFEDPEARAQLEQVGIPPSTAFKAAYHRSLELDVDRALAQAGLTRRPASAAAGQPPP